MFAYVLKEGGTLKKRGKKWLFVAEMFNIENSNMVFVFFFILGSW